MTVRVLSMLDKPVYQFTIETNQPRVEGLIFPLVTRTMMERTREAPLSTTPLLPAGAHQRFICVPITCKILSLLQSTKPVI